MSNIFILPTDRSSHVLPHRNRVNLGLMAIKGYSTFSKCNILTFEPAVNQETGVSGRRYQGITLTG